MQSKTIRILVFVEASWGEIHWILPVLKYIKEHRPEVSVTMFVNAYRIEEFVGDNDLMVDILRSCVDDCITLEAFISGLDRVLLRYFNSFKTHQSIIAKIMRRIHKRLKDRLLDREATNLAEKILAYVNPHVLTRDTGGDYGLRKAVLNLARKKNLKIYIVPHGSDLVMLPAVKMPELTMEGDLLLCPSQQMYDYYSYLGKNVKKMVVGNPRYDQWWIKYLKTLRDSGKITVSWQPKDFNVYFVTRGPHPAYLTRENFNYLIRQTAEEVLSYPDTFLIIRPHPRQSIEQLKGILKNFDQSRWTIDLTDVICISEDINLVISMWSSMILDCLAAGLPVIEFFRFEGSKLRWLEDEQGRPTTPYRADGLALPANDSAELKDLIQKFKSNGTVEKMRMIENFQNLVPQAEDGATVTSMKVILEGYQLQEV